MFRSVVISLFLIAGCGPPLAQAQYCGSAYRSYGYRSYVAPYRAYVAPYRANVLYSVGYEAQVGAIAERVTANLLAIQLQQQQAANLRLQQQLQQSYQQQYTAPQYAPQPQYGQPQQPNGYSAPQAQGLGGLRVQGEFAGVIQQGGVPAAPDPGGGGSPLPPSGGSVPPQGPPQGTDLDAKVMAILQESCVQCHGQNRREAGIDLRGDAATMDDLLAHRVVFQVLIGNMPKAPVAKLLDAKNQVLINWLAERGVQKPSAAQ